MCVWWGVGVVCLFVFVKRFLKQLFIFFCECDLVKPHWLEIGTTFHLNTELDCQFNSCLTLKKKKKKRFRNY